MDEFGTPISRRHLLEGYKALFCLIWLKVEDIDVETFACPHEALAAAD